MTFPEFKAHVLADMPDTRWKFVHNKNGGQSFRATLWIKREPTFIVEFQYDRKSRPWVASYYHRAIYRVHRDVSGATFKRVMTRLLEAVRKAIPYEERIIMAQEKHLAELQALLTQEKARVQEMLSILSAAYSNIDPMQT